MNIAMEAFIKIFRGGHMKPLEIDQNLAEDIQQSEDERRHMLKLQERNKEALLYLGAQVEIITRNQSGNDPPYS